MTDPAHGERVAVVGSRAHPDVSIVRAYVRSLPPGTVVVSGGAEGVDRAAEETAIECGLCVLMCEPPISVDMVMLEPHADSYRRHPARPMIKSSLRPLYRNTTIAVLCDRVVVFPDGSRGGCWDAAREAVRFRRPVEIRWADGRVEAFTGKRPARPLPTLPKRDGLIEPGVHISNKGCRNAYTNTSCPCAEGTCWVAYARGEHKVGEPALDIGAFIAQQRRAAQRG